MCACMNHRKKTKAEVIRLIRRKPIEKLELLFAELVLVVQHNFCNRGLATDHNFCNR